MRKERSFVTCCLALVALLVCSLPLAAQDQVKHPVAFAVSPRLGIWPSNLRRHSTVFMKRIRFAGFQSVLPEKDK